MSQTTSFRQHIEEQQLVEALEDQGQDRLILEQHESGEWSNGMTADELLSSLNLNDNNV